MVSLPGVVCDGGGLAGSFRDIPGNACREAIRQLAELRTRLDVAVVDGHLSSEHSNLCRKRSVTRASW
jgi:hypothetical protein